jgi:hypothetical protein
MFNAFVANLSKDLVKWGIDKNKEGSGANPNSVPRSEKCWMIIPPPFAKERADIKALKDPRRVATKGTHQMTRLLRGPHSLHEASNFGEFQFGLISRHA